MNIKTPPMGWNSWDCYGAAVNEDIVKKNADYMAKYLKQYGWEYIVVDIQWYEPTAKDHYYNSYAELCMDDYSRLIPAENRFPSAAGGKGFGPLADYVHSLGLKFGIHIMRGIPRQAVHSNTKILGCKHTAKNIPWIDSVCCWNTDMYPVNPKAEGAKEYYDSIFSLYASWGVDFIKCDAIGNELPQAEDEIRLISQSIKDCGREMLLSLSPGPAVLEKAELYKETCTMWRMTGDFWDNWEALYNMFERCEKWSIHNGAGHWADADMLPVGAINQIYNPDNRTKFTKDEQITMLSLWSIFRSPLMIGGELTKNDDFTMQLLTNEETLRMHKNSRHSHQVWRKEIDGIEHILWTAASSDGGQYVAIFNLGENASEISIPLTDVEIYEPVNSTELWNGKKQDNITELTVKLNSHGAAAFLLTRPKN